MTLFELADCLDLDLTTVSKIENNKRKAQPDIIPKLAKQFGINLKELEMEYLSYKIAEMVIDEPFSTKVLSMAKRKIIHLKKDKH